MLNVKCKFCKIQFIKSPSEIRKTKNNFCSRSCAAKYNNAIRPKKELKNKCKQCKKGIYSHLIYCSKVCRKQHKYNNIAKTKQCYYCKVTKSIDKFYINKNRRTQSFCKTCSIIRSKYRLQQLKLKCLEYKGNKCIKCGYNKCPASLDFHHRKPEIKNFSISKIRLTSWKKNKNKLIVELDKCDLICKNCHAELHFTEVKF